MINTIETNGTAVKPAVNTEQNNGKRANTPSVASKRRAVLEYLADSEACEGDHADTLKARFMQALVARARADKPLAAIVAEMIEDGIERDEAIEWGIETGLSESYVRSTVSRLYSDVDGGLVAKGRGRKSSPDVLLDAAAMIKRFKGDHKAAAKHALAVSRAVQKLAKEASASK